MRQILVTTLVVMLLLLWFALPASAAWQDIWTRAPAGGGGPHSKVVGNNQTAYMLISDTADTVALGNLSVGTLKLNAYQTTICLDTDTTTLDAAGAFTMDVMYYVGVLGTTTAAVVIVSLSSGTPCVFDVPPGNIFFDVTTAADTDGQIFVQGRGGL